jgi:hypothetical protein
MFKIWALTVETDDEQNINLFWRHQDAIEILPEILSEFIEDNSVAAHAGLLMGNPEKLFSYMAEQGIGIELEEVEVEGKIDARQLSRLEKLVTGPRLVKEPKKQSKKFSGERSFINGIEVKL